VGPSEHESRESDDGEGKVIEDAAELPKTDSVGEEGAEWRKWRLRRSWGWCRLRSLHGNQYAPMLLIVKYFMQQRLSFAVAGDLGCASGKGARVNEAARLRRGSGCDMLTAKFRGRLRSWGKP